MVKALSGISLRSKINKLGAGRVMSGFIYMITLRTILKRSTDGRNGGEKKAKPNGFEDCRALAATEKSDWTLEAAR